MAVNLVATMAGEMAALMVESLDEMTVVKTVVNLGVQLVAWTAVRKVDNSVARTVLLKVVTTVDLRA